MSKFRNIKVHVPTPEISEAVQIELAKHGCRWEFNGKVVNRERFPFLYIDKYGDIRWNLCESDFNGDGRKEVPYQSILDPFYEVKLAWANGEVVQRKIDTDDGLRWVDWHDSNSLDLECGYDWRVKPKTKTIKQWEQKYYDQKTGLVKTCAVKESPHFVWKEWVLIGEAYEAEYEVPND